MFFRVSEAVAGGVRTAHRGAVGIAGQQGGIHTALEIVPFPHHDHMKCVSCHGKIWALRKLEEGVDFREG